MAVVAIFGCVVAVGCLVAVASLFGRVQGPVLVPSPLKAFMKVRCLVGRRASSIAVVHACGCSCVLCSPSTFGFHCCKQAILYVLVVCATYIYFHNVCMYERVDARITSRTLRRRTTTR